MTQILKYVLAIEASWKVALLLAPVGIVEVVIKVGNFLSVLLAEILLTVGKQELVGVIGVRVPHHSGIGSHFHKELTHVTSIYHAESLLAFALHIAIIILHLPWSFRWSQVSTRRIELQIHVVTQLNIVGVLPVDEVVEWIVVSTTSHKGPEHIGCHRRCYVALRQQRRYLVVESHTNKGIGVACRFTNHVILNLNHLADDPSTL